MSSRTTLPSSYARISRPSLLQRGRIAVSLRRTDGACRSIVQLEMGDSTATKLRGVSEAFAVANIVILRVSMGAVGLFCGMGFAVIAAVFMGLALIVSTMFLAVRVLAFALVALVHAIVVMLKGLVSGELLILLDDENLARVQEEASVRLIAPASASVFAMPVDVPHRKSDLYPCDSDT